MTEYNKRLTELDEILKYFSNEDLHKIPEDIRIAIKENKDKKPLQAITLAALVRLSFKLGKDTI